MQKNEESLVLDDDLLSEYSYSYSSVAHVAVMSRAQQGGSQRSQSQDFVVVDVGKNGQDWTVESMAKILSKAGTDLIVVAVDYEGSDDSQTHGELVDHVVSHC